MSTFNNQMALNVTLEDLPEEWRNIVNTATEQFKEKCLLSYAKDQDGNVYQKQFLPRVLLEGQADPNDVAARNAMHETISRAMSTTLLNHNDTFLSRLTNAMKEALNANTGFRGPAYSNKNTGRQSGAPVQNGSGGHTSGSSFAQPGGGNCALNGQHPMQQPMGGGGSQANCGTCQSAAKFAPAGARITRDFNAPPYQGRVALGEIPPGYHYVSEYYALNANENPGYQNSHHGTQSTGCQGHGNQHV